ncbi:MULTISPECIES: hypothetical protein [unclassified Pseudoclavibacter]|uniref:hypothetical protein n=1 Tax=unclassified Pseudoclavibacter TaxID=2615177 RepID=UPI001BA819D0|nr:hypothetical protein [Pseudoclavibacter sp. Marseille-Q4354]MBS3180014.1 hypothetical protein [Pseudoclavibacter sp. Marseille-Q4354]
MTTTLQAYPDAATQHQALVQRLDDFDALGIQYTALARPNAAGDKRPAFGKGFTKRPIPEITAESREKVLAGQSTGVRMELGVRGKITTSGRTYYPVVVESENPTEKCLPEVQQRMNAALAEHDRTGAVSRMLAGHADISPSGGMHLHAWLEAADDIDFKRRLRALPTRSAAHLGETAYEILATNVIVAPSYGVHASGLPYTHAAGSNPQASPTVLTWSELTAIATAMQVADDGSLASTKVMHRLEGHTIRSRDIAEAYDKECSAEDVAELLLEHGWTIRAGELPDELKLKRPGSKNPDRGQSASLGGEQGSLLRVWSTSDARLGPGFYTPFALRAFLVHGGNPVACAEAIATPPEIEVDVQFSVSDLVDDGPTEDPHADTDWEAVAASVVPPTDAAIAWAMARFETQFTADQALLDEFEEPVHAASEDGVAEDLLAENGFTAAELADMREEVDQHEPLREVDPRSIDSESYVTLILGELARRRVAGMVDVPQYIRHVDRTGATLAHLRPVLGGRPTSTRQFAKDDLPLGFVQPVVEKKSGRDFAHNHPTKITATVEERLQSDTNLATARIVSQAPVLSAEGRTLQHPGYYRGEQVLIHDDPTRSFDRARYVVSETPSQQEAQAAFEYLHREFLRDFPFASDADLARGLLYPLTIASRHLVPTVPGFMLAAADRGSGKSLFREVSCMIATGSDAYQRISVYANDDTETRKAFVTATLAGRIILHADEVGRGDAITSKAVTELLTMPPSALNERILGGNSSAALDSFVVSVAGNNVRAGADLNRRFIEAKFVLQSGIAHERDESKFRHPDIRKWAAKHRPELLAALHTILAYGIQNPAAEIPVFGGFGEWRRVVLGSLTHISLNGHTLADLAVDGRAAWTADQDDDAFEWIPFVELLYRRSSMIGRELRMTEVVKAVDDSKPFVELPTELRMTLGESVTTRARKWGKKVGAMLDTAIPAGDGVILRIKSKLTSGSHRWWVETEGDVIAWLQRDAPPVGSFAPNVPFVVASIDDPRFGRGQQTGLGA